MTEEEWLAGLKPGDPVLVEFTWVRKPNDYVAARVERITPSGVVLDNGKSYDARMLLQPTPERLEAIERDALRKRLAQVRWEYVPLGKLRAVAAVLD